MATLYAGTSGYSSPTWKPRFYPEDLSAARFLRHCVAEANELATPDEVTAGFACYRLRRPPYDELALMRLRRRADELTRGGRDVYVLFKHEDDAGGALEAERLLAA